MKEKKPAKYILVYRQLYDKIKSGFYNVGDALPGENDLSVEMNVSRMTLRRALALLQEDELIENLHGKGNYVKSVAKSKNQLSVFGNSMYKSFSDTIDEVELDFRMELPSAFNKQLLDSSPAAVILASRWYKKRGVARCYSLSFIPIEIISKHSVDLVDNDCMMEFLEHKIYDIVDKKELEFSYTTTGNFVSNKYNLSSDSNFIILGERLLDSGNTVCYTKFYIPIQDFRYNMEFTK